MAKKMTKVVENSSAKKEGGYRYGGRQKGTPNKGTQDLFKLCEEKGVNVFEGLLEFCKNPDPIMRFNAHKEAAKYLYPTRKAIEMKAEVVNLEEKKKKIDELKEKLNATEG